MQLLLKRETDGEGLELRDRVGICWGKIYQQPNYVFLEVSDQILPIFPKEKFKPQCNNCSGKRFRTVSEAFDFREKYCDKTQPLWTESP